MCVALLIGQSFRDKAVHGLSRAAVLGPEILCRVGEAPMYCKLGGLRGNSAPLPVRIAIDPWRLRRTTGPASPRPVTPQTPRRSVRRKAVCGACDNVSDKLRKRLGKWTAEVKPLSEDGMSPSVIAARFGKRRQAVWNVLNGKTAVYESTKKRGS